MNNNEPVVLGKIKKGKTGKPLVVLILFLFIGSIILFLPTIMNYFGDYSILDLIKNGEIISFFQNHDSYVNKKDDTSITTETKVETSNLINSKTVISYSNFTLDTFNLNEDEISFNINTSTNINFNKSSYYLVLSKDDKELFNIKLVGEINGKESYTFKFKEKLESIVDIKGIIKEIKSSEYPKFNLSSDESGLASITCTNENRKIEYMFQYNKLISIKDELNYEDDSDKYFDEFEKYNKLSENLKNIGATSNVTENMSGFKFSANIDLTEYDYDKNADYDYYSLDTNSNIVNFEMNSKGYDCK